MIIGLTGKKQHGKDTVGGILVTEHGYTRLSYADALKESAAALFGIDAEWWDAWKNDPSARVKIEAPLIKGGTPIKYTSLTVREFLQRYGTEAHRDVFGDSFWTDVVERQIAEIVGVPPRGNIVITDVRFDNEAEIIRKYGGIVVEVYRPQVADAGYTIDTHASEETPEADMMLWNGEDIEALRQRIAQLEREGWKQAIV